MADASKTSLEFMFFRAASLPRSKSHATPPLKNPGEDESVIREAGPRVVLYRNLRTSPDDSLTKQLDFGRTVEPLIGIESTLAAKPPAFIEAVTRSPTPVRPQLAHGFDLASLRHAGASGDRFKVAEDAKGCRCVGIRPVVAVATRIHGGRLGNVAECSRQPAALRISMPS